MFKQTSMQDDIIGSVPLRNEPSRGYSGVNAFDCQAIASTLWSGCRDITQDHRAWPLFSPRLASGDLRWLMTTSGFSNLRAGDPTSRRILIFAVANIKCHAALADNQTAAVRNPHHPPSAGCPEVPNSTCRDDASSMPPCQLRSKRVSAAQR